MEIVHRIAPLRENVYILYVANLDGNEIALFYLREKKAKYSNIWFVS
jgi:hypothetical protein